MLRPWPSRWVPTRTLPPRPQWAAVSTHSGPITEPEQNPPSTFTCAPHGAPPSGTVPPPMMSGHTSAWDRGTVPRPATSVARTNIPNNLSRITSPQQGNGGRETMDAATASRKLTNPIVRLRRPIATDPKFRNCRRRGGTVARPSPRPSLQRVRLHDRLLGGSLCVGDLRLERHRLRVLRVQQREQPPVPRPEHGRSAARSCPRRRRPRPAACGRRSRASWNRCAAR